MQNPGRCMIVQAKVNLSNQCWASRFTKKAFTQIQQTRSESRTCDLGFWRRKLSWIE